MPTTAPRSRRWPAGSPRRASSPAPGSPAGTAIDRQLEQARTSDPVTGQRRQLESALAKASAALTRMVEAFQEELITIDELRARMPDLRAREAGLRGQLQALDAHRSLTARSIYLRLADDLEGFLTQLRGHADTTSVAERRAHRADSNACELPLPLL
jgi:site-specific DNA recombinase